MNVPLSKTLVAQEKASLTLHPDRLFPGEPGQRAIARRLYQLVKDLPIVSPHGHTDPSWFARNEKWTDPASLLITPDHYVFRMLYSQGIAMDRLGVPRDDGGPVEQDPRKIWALFAQNYHLFRGTPSRLWHNWVYTEVFGLDVKLNSHTADHYFDVISSKLAQDDFTPRALFERFNIEVIATTESPLDNLEHHAAIAQSGWGGRVITAFRPDPVLDPDYEGFVDNIKALGAITGHDTLNYQGYLAALRDRRAFFKTVGGATSTDHGHPTARTANLSRSDAEALFARVTTTTASPADAELFRAHMLVEMAAMSVEDGLVMQIHPGAYRNHNQTVFESYGRDKGCDIPMRTNYVQDLKPLLDRFGSDPRVSIILFTLDESTYARELAPLAGHYPALKLGPSWWFHDSPEGMRRFRENVTETAGFYNTVGFNDDTRAFLSIPARHDVARRMDCNWLSQLVCDHRLDEDEAAELAYDLAYRLAKEAYKL
jgi:glucuronate isomerase